MTTPPVRMPVSLADSTAVLTGEKLETLALSKIHITTSQNVKPANQAYSILCVFSLKVFFPIFSFHHFPLSQPVKVIVRAF